MSKIRVLSAHVVIALIVATVTALSVSCQNDAVRPPVDGCETGDCGDGGDGGDNGPIFLGNPPVIINEINPLNLNYTDEFGGNPGWVEFYNPADTAVDLGGYALTNSLNRKIWTFGNVVMEPQSYLVVFLSGRNVPDFDSQGDVLDLLGSSVGAWNWSDNLASPVPGRSTAEHEYVSGAMVSGKLVADNNAGTGLTWTSAVVMLVLEDWDTTAVVDLSRARQMRFRGFVSEGARLEVRLAQSGMDDWETWPALITGTGEADAIYTIDLPVTDPVYPNLKKIYGLRFSNGPGFFGTIEFSFNSITAPRRASDLHASFELSNSGGRLFLMDPDGHIRDSLAYPAALRGLSYAKSKDGGWKYSDPPTPGAANEGDFYDGQTPPLPSAGIPESGFYDAGHEFTLPPGTDGSVVCCDTTGRLPTAQSPLKSGMTVAVAHSIVMRCAQFKPGSFGSDPIMRTYITGRRPDLPVVSIAIDPVDMFDPTVGLYSNGPGWTPVMPHDGANYWADTELPVQLEFFEPEDSRAAWNQGGGLRIFGNWSRIHPKKAVVIGFRRGLGTSRLNYPLFPEHPRLTRFTHIVLRNNGNNADRDYIRDMLATSLTEGLGIDYQKGRAVVVFYNGRYFGIHNLRERSNGDYFETNYDIDEDLVDLVKASGEVSCGSDADYQSVLTWLRGVTLDDDNLKTLEQRIDVDNFTYNHIARIYLQDKDWPGNNMKRWRTHSPPSRWKWLMYDTDHGFGNTDMHNISFRNTPMLDFATAPNGPDWPNPPHSTLILRKLLENEGYRRSFINRFSLLLATYFSPQTVDARINALMAPIASEIQHDQQRWGWSASWMNRCLNDIRNFGATRAGVMQREIETFFGLSDGVDLTLSVSGNGRIFVHGLEVRGGGAEFRAYAQAPVVLRAEPNGGAVFQGWSDGVTEAERTVTVNESMRLEAIFGASF